MTEPNESVSAQPAVRASGFSTDPVQGLSAAAVAERVEAGKVNLDDRGKTRTVGQILRENICTLFNLINVVLAAAVLLVGSPKNATFLAIITANTCIGIVQEIRSKRTMDRLTFLSASRVKVIRDGVQTQVRAQEVVQDDLMVLNPGDQVQADGVVLSGVCHVDESFITGEADAIVKAPGDPLLAGSFLLSGHCTAQAMQVGQDKYISALSSGARFIKKSNSEIMNTLQWVVRVVSVLIVPLGTVIFLQQLHLPQASVQSAVVNTTASLIGMIPEGLMLLTSTALAVSVIRLSQSRVLVQQLYCIETLARVDVLCLDKTGTLTEGCMEWVDTVLLEGEEDTVSGALCSLTHAIADHNATFMALAQRYQNCGIVPWEAVQSVSFSSKTKWSGASFSQQGTYCIGAAEFLLPQLPPTVQDQLQRSAVDYRTLLLVHSDAPFQGENLPPADTLRPVALVRFRDKVRQTAAPTLSYFAQQGVEIKVISGDSPQTVAGIAKYAGVEHWARMVDATTLHTEAEVEAAATRYTVFGRVTPQQKKLLVSALRRAGHTVAMTGDGVNDVLALKEADCSIAMASGTDAARNASELVLLDSNFDALPKVVAEGRRCINNVQRASTLFLIKTVYSGLLALLFAFLTIRYPFQPIQMSLIGVSCIGVPAFFLALQPNQERVQGSFLQNVLVRALPGGLSVFLQIGLILLAGTALSLSEAVISTLCVATAGFTGLLILLRISRPFNWYRGALFVSMNVSFWGGLLFFTDFFGLQPMSLTLLWMLLLAMAMAYGLLTLLFFLVDRNRRRIDAALSRVLLRRKP